MNFLMTLYGGYFDYVFSTIWTIVILVGIAMTIFIKVGSKMEVFKRKNKIEVRINFLDFSLFLKYIY